MNEITKTTKLDNVGYDIRGPVAEEAARMAREGIDVIALNTGNPPTFGFFAPESIERAICDNIRDSEGYSDSYGIPEAIDAIRAYSESKGIEGLGYGDVFTGNGVSELISISLQALINTGDEILVPTPDYPLWTSVTTLCGGNARGYICDESADWAPDIADIKRKITPRTKAIVVINPNNPTGALYSRDNIAEIMNVAREHGLVVFADEIYDRLLFDGAVHHSCAAVAPDVFTVTFNGLSKSHMLAGFRCGWMVISGDRERAADYIEGIRMLSSMRLCANVPSQSVVKVALDDAYSAAPLLRPGGRLYEQRAFIYEAMNEIPGLSSTKPKAAFYLFPRIDIKRFNIRDDERFVLDFLHEHHVLVTHGRGFNWPEPDHFRIVYLPPLEDLWSIAGKMSRFLCEYVQE
ncbi:MAG: pyridoxal phosphate-dependent aminotransferase [Clostridiales Family XIII bacterium]|jgi:alanine-synthesizing transaminase|nr:pyridoxal phosphate-dependent aminotransferase [Clostridiales Family XIII bacterium]